MSQGVLAGVALCTVLIYLLIHKIGSREVGLPPGPPTLPLLGNLHIFPTEFAHYKFTEWARQYGGIYSLKLATSTMIVLNDAGAIKELMDKRSATTSDRPPAYFVEYVTDGLNLGLARYSDTWRAMRKAAHAMLTPQVSMRHVPIQKAEATQLLHDIIQSPEAFITHIRRYSSSVIMSILYGQRSPRYETPATTDFFAVHHHWEQILEPGAQPPVDLIPILKYVPARFAKWKRELNIARRDQRKLYFGFFDETKRLLESGRENGSFMEQLLKRQEEFGLDREHLAHLGGTLIEGAADTTSVYIQSFILMLTAFPAEQKKAQEEIDTVIGHDCMPKLADIERLPYVRALIQEVHRFRPVAPLLVPHATTATEEYRGYIIPKGTTIFMNFWAICHDPELFDDPDAFIPERFLSSQYGTKEGVDDSDFRATLPFGAGRRICPGMHVASNSININVMNLLWAFDFSNEVDSNGNEISVDIWGYDKGILPAPTLFKCKIVPRSREKVEIIEREFQEATTVFEQFEFALGEEDRKFVARTRDRQ